MNPSFCPTTIPNDNALKLRKRLKSLLGRIATCLQRNRGDAYLVGGAVRDLIMARKIIDLDIVLTSRLKAMVQALSSNLNGRVRFYPEFYTASIVPEQGMRLDLSQARSEFYSKPAALPAVLPSNLLWDLFRRDFTINAIAVCLNQYDFGTIIDPFGGVNDIRRKKVRIIHRRSFVDDPTRIFRAVRYSSRLGFDIERTTKQLMKMAVHAGYQDLLSGERIRNELFLIMAEPTWLKAVVELRKLGILKLSEEVCRNLRRINKHRFLYLIAHLRNSYQKRIPLTKNEKRVIDDFKRIGSLPSRLRNIQTKSKLYFLLFRLADEAISILHDLGSRAIKEKIRMFKNIKSAKPLVSGKDLVKMGIKPGRDYHRILDAILTHQLDGRIRTRTEAELAARRMACR